MVMNAGGSHRVLKSWSLRVVGMCIVLGLANPVFAGGHARAPFSDVKGSAQVADAQVDAAQVACRQVPNRRCVADLALAAAEKIRDVDSRGRAFARLAEAYVGTGSIEPVLAALDRLPDSPWNASILEQAALTLAKAGDVAGALATAEKIDDRSKRASALVRLAAAIAASDADASRRAADLAFAVAERIEVAHARLLAFAEIARMSSAIGDLETARAAVDAALATTATGVSPYAVAWIAAAQAALGDSDSANTALQAMKNDPNLRVYAMARMAEAQAAAGRVASARETIDSALIVADGIKENASDHEPSESGCVSSNGDRDNALQEIAEVQAQIGDLEAAMTTTIKIEDAYARAEITDRIVKAHAGADNVELLRQTLKAVSTPLYAIKSDYCRDSNLAAVAAAQATVGDIGAALTTAEAIELPRVRTRALVEMAESVAKAGDLAAIEKVASAPVRAMAWARLATVRTEARDLEAGRSAVAAALKASRLIDDPKLLVVTLARIVEAQARLGEVESVRRTIGQMPGEFDAVGRRNFALAVIVEAQTNAEQFAAALATAETIEDTGDRFEALLGIATALPH